MKEKKRLCWLLPVVILLLAAVGWFFWKYTFVDGTVTARSADTIDLRGREISEEKLRTIESRFPDAHILWDVTVGGKSFDGESESIVTVDFTTEDIPSFARLKNLKEADVSACSDFSAILALQNALPEVRVHWTVPLGEKSFDGESESIAIQDASADMLRAAITRLPKLRTLVLTDSTLSPAALYPAMSRRSILPARRSQKRIFPSFLRRYRFFQTRRASISRTAVFPNTCCVIFLRRTQIFLPNGKRSSSA